MVFYNIFLNNDLPFNRSHSIIKQRAYVNVSHENMQMGYPILGRGD